MKRILLILLLMPCLVYSQKKSKGFGYVGGSFFANKILENRAGVVAGLGIAPNKNVSIGAAFDFFVFQKDFRFMQGYADFRALIPGLGKPITSFIAVQPGYIFYNQTKRILNFTATTKGDFALNLMTGIISKPKKGIGPFLEIGYCNMGFTTNGIKQKYGGLKINGGFSF